MSTKELLQTEVNDQSSQYNVQVGQYGEGMYCINCPPTSPQVLEPAINGLLFNNQGVGLVGGYFDDNLTVCMISGLAVKLLGYANCNDFLKHTQSQFVNVISSQEEQYYVKNRLQSNKTDITSCFLRGKKGNAISVRMSNAVVKGQDGKKMWLLSIRKLGELHHDSLTGGYNRRGFINYIKGLQVSGVDVKQLAIITVNIKGFKAINDLFGSDFGDAMLITAYQHFATCALKPVICARKEADKFLLLVKRENLDLNVLTEVLKLPYSYGEKTYLAQCICGIYYIDDDTMQINTMLDCSKVAREKVQDAFIKPYAVYEPSMLSTIINQATALALFDDALQRNEFQVYYQPVVDCKSGQVVSAEALIRWETPDGILSPGVFIPAFEENGCIVKLDEYVLTKVIRHLREKAQSHLPMVPISVNLSRMDFFDTERIDRLYRVFRSDSVVRNYVHFEITETSYLSVKERQAQFIKNINALGGSVYIDDFGVANSSIDMLSQYDFGVLKLDMQFIKEMEKNSKVYVLVQTTIHMAHQLKMRVVAEGVETLQQLQLLQSADCDYIQGYYFSKPLDEQHFAQYLSTHASN